MKAHAQACLHLSFKLGSVRDRPLLGFAVSNGVPQCTDHPTVQAQWSLTLETRGCAAPTACAMPGSSQLGAQGVCVCVGGGEAGRRVDAGWQTFLCR